MMDQSFDAFGGGGGAWNDPVAAGGDGGGGFDQSFAATQAAPKNAEFDRITIPVTIATLNSLDSSAEKITFGKYSFSTVRVIGEVVNTVDQAGGVKYMVRDWNNEHQEPFPVIRYFGVDSNDTESFIEGTIVHVVGKIRSFDGYTAVVAFKVQEVNEMGHRDVFPKEARIAELYFTKNIPERIQNNDVSGLAGTMLSSEAPPSNRPNGGNKNAPVTPSRTAYQNPVSAPTTPNVMNGSAVYQATQHPGANRGWNYQQNKIYDYLVSHPNDEGISVTAIKDAIKGDANFDDDITFLAEGGIIYSTIDDNHYAIIT